MGLELSSGAPWQRVTAAATLLLLVLVRCTSGSDAAADYSKATTLELALAAAEAITKDWESGRVDYSRPGPHDRRGDEDEDDDEDDDDLGVESAHNFYRPPDDYCFQCDDGRYTNWIHPELFTAAANGDKEAMSIIGRIYMTREEMRDRFFYTDEASRGIDQPPSGTAFDEGATRAFGMPTGEGIQDTRPSAALKWYARAAEREHAFARGQVGGLFMQGARGIAKNLERARTNLEMAVELGDVYAMHWLGVLNERRNVTRARELWTQAVAKGRQQIDAGNRANVVVVQQARERIRQLDKSAEGVHFGRLCAVLVGVCALMCGVKYARDRGG